MKRAFPKKVKPVPSCAADSNRTVGDIRQVLAGPRKVRTSAAMIGLAISMGASSILLPQQGEGAGATEPRITADTSANDSGSWSALEAEGASTEEAGTQMPEASALEPQVQEESVTLTERGPASSQVAVNAGDRGEAERAGEVNLTLPSPQELARQGNAEGASFSWKIEEIRSESAVSIEEVVQSGESRLHPSLAELWDEESVSSVDEQPLINGIESSVGISPESSGPGPEMAPSGLFPRIEIQGSNEETVLNPIDKDGRASEPSAGDIRSDEVGTAPSLVNSERTSQGWESYLEKNPTGNPGEIPQLGRTEVNSPQSTGFVPLVTPELDIDGEAVESELSRVQEAEKDDPTALNLAEPDMNGAIAIAAVENSSASRIYQVSSGDTLDAIALRNGISPQKIVEANGLNDPDLLSVNQTIKIPLAATEPGPTAIAWEPNSLTSDERGDLSATAKSDTVVLPKAMATDSSFSLMAPTKPSEAIASIPETVVSVIDRSSGISGTLPAIGNETLAQAVPSVETEPADSNYIDGLRADILKLRQKYREQEALGQHAGIQAVETAAQATEAAPIPLMANSSDRPESLQANATEPQALENRYVDSLRAEIEKLREKYKTENLSLEASGESVPQTLPTIVAVRSNSTAPSGPSERIDPQFNPGPNESLENESLQAELTQLREKYRTQQSESTANSSAPTAPPTQREQILAVAPVGSETYAPLMQPAVGQIVSPELPPLKAPDTYLPNSQPRFNGFIWPAQGVLSSGYGWRWGRMHKGIDIAGPTGTPIYAAATGVVLSAGWNSGGYGNLVEIEHPDGSITLYAHNHRIMVEEGQQVEQGQQVAEMGSTGFSTGPHLHFEIHTSGQGAVNPMALLPPE